MSEKSSFDQLYSGLQAISTASFPKKCSTCNKIYESAESYIKETESVPTHETGLSASYDPMDKVNLVELYRNCSCGSTLMDVFNDRRDMSAAGDKRRKIFSSTLDLLIKAGMKRDEARDEIIKLMKGGVSEKIKMLGLSFQKNSNEKKNE